MATASPDITKFAYATATVASEAMTASKSYHSLTFVGGPVNLKTINGGSIGDLLLLDMSDPTKTVVIKSELGNIILAGDDSDFTLTGGRSIMMIYRSSGWTELSRSICKAKPVISIDGSTAPIVIIHQIVIGGTLDLSTVVSSSSDASITYGMASNNYVSLSGNTVTVNELGGAVQITVTQASSPTYTAASKIFTLSTLTMYASLSSFTNNRYFTVDFSSGDNVAIACYEGEHVTVTNVTNGSNICVLVNYGGLVYTYAAGTLTNVTVFPGTEYPVYGGDGIISEGIAILVQPMPISVLTTTSVDTVVPTNSTVSLSDYITSSQTGAGANPMVFSRDGVTIPDSFTAGATPESITFTANQAANYTIGYRAAQSITFTLTFKKPNSLSGSFGTDQVVMTLGATLDLSDLFTTESAGTMLRINTWLIVILPSSFSSVRLRTISSLIKVSISLRASAMSRASYLRAAL